MGEKVIISIVGGGSTGIAFLAQFAKKITKYLYKDQFEINIFEKENPLGTGLAYNVKSHSLLLNSSTEAFSIYSEDPKNFLSWLLQFPEKWRPYFPEIGDVNEFSFLPRKLAGLYLQDSASQAKEICNFHNIKINLIRDEVVDIVQNGYYTQILVSNGRRYKSDYIILCTGNLPSEKFNEFKQYPSYFHSPYKEEERIKETIPLDASVLILGTRLSAIDVAMLLKENGHQGKITMASREGIFPAVKNELKHYMLKYLNLKNIKIQLKRNNFQLKIDDLLKLVKKEVSYIYQKDISYKEILTYSGDPQRILREDLYKAKRKKLLWGKMQMEFFNLIEEYWKAFSLDEKRKYLKNYLGIMQRYTSSFAVVNGEKILALMKRGQLTIETGIDNLNYRKDECIFSCELNNKKWKYNKKFDYVINATGSGKDLQKFSPPLYANLAYSNKVQFNPFGGLNVSIKDFSILTNKNFTAKLYAAGSPTFGSVFFTNFVLTSAKQTEVILTDILKHACPINSGISPNQTSPVDQSEAALIT